MNERTNTIARSAHFHSNRMKTQVNVARSQRIILQCSDIEHFVASVLMIMKCWRFERVAHCFPMELQKKQSRRKRHLPSNRQFGGSIKCFYLTDRLGQKTDWLWLAHQSGLVCFLWYFVSYRTQAQHIPCTAPFHWHSMRACNHMYRSTYANANDSYWPPIKQ